MTTNDVFADGGEMGELMRSVRWADTPLVPLECSTFAMVSLVVSVE